MCADRTDVFYEELTELKRETALLEEFTKLVAASVYQPIFCDSDGPDRYFRYPSPGFPHFCVLKYARVVSSLNAAIELARAGFNQELCIIIRVMVESATIIEWAIESREPDAAHAQSVDDHIASFFADHDRSPGMPHKPATIKQETIHRDIARIFDQRLKDVDGYSGGSSKELMSRTFLAYSYYVHGRYPELMDMFGGSPARLHLSGMANTPKDGENLDILATFVQTAKLTAWRIALELKLTQHVMKHSMLSQWYLDLQNDRSN